MQRQQQEERWRREWQPTPVSSPGESHGQRSLAGYSPWSHKEPDTNEQLSTSNNLPTEISERTLSLPVISVGPFFPAVWVYLPHPITPHQLQAFHDPNTISHSISCPCSFIPKYNLSIFVFPQHLTQVLAQSWWPMNTSCWPCCGEGDWPPRGKQQLTAQAGGQNARVYSRDQLHDPGQNQPL